MSMNLELPKSIIDVLGPEPRREALEAILLFLIAENRMSVARAGEILELDRHSAVRWYTSHGYSYPDLSDDEVSEEFLHARQP